MEEEYIRVLFNACYGGYSISKEGIEEINKRVEKKYKSDYALCCGIDNRTNPVVLEVYDLLGSDRFSGKHAKIREQKIKAPYKNFIYIKEYDGLENVLVNTHDYKIHSILDSKEMTDEEKVKTLRVYFGLDTNEKGILQRKGQQDYHDDCLFDYDENSNYENTEE
jgi:hypothetical protein